MLSATEYRPAPDWRGAARVLKAFGLKNGGEKPEPRKAVYANSLRPKYAVGADTIFSESLRNLCQ